MSSRTKLVLLLSVLLFLAIGSTAFAATATMRTFEMVQQQHTLARRGDVRSIRPWMTIPYIARTYHVPENYLYRSLSVMTAHPPRRTTLYALAAHSKRPVNDLIHTLQKAILTYRKQHSPLHHDCLDKHTGRNCIPGGTNF